MLKKVLWLGEARVVVGVEEEGRGCEARVVVGVGEDVRRALSLVLKRRGR